MWTKNIELGIAAFLQLRKATGTDYQLIIAGMVDSKNQHYYERLMEMAGTDQGIRFHIDPTDQEMDQYYKTCGAVLFTSFNEDLGLTPMEAMARGKPVVAVNSGGPREVVVHHQTGYLVHADPNSFSTAMEALIADEPRQRQMGRIGAEEVKRFTWEKFVDGLDSALDAMVAREAQ
jgi:alpha-1,3/alpha-1,6-mannosyltransferase